MSLIKKRSTPNTIRHLRRKLLLSGNPEKDKVKKEKYIFYKPNLSLFIFAAEYDNNTPDEVTLKINNALNKIKKYYTPDMIASALPLGYSVFVNSNPPGATTYSGTKLASFSASTTPEEIHDPYLAENTCSNNLTVPKILFNTGTEDALMVEIEVVAKIAFDLFNLVSDELEFGSKDNPGYLLALDRVSLSTLSEESHMQFAFQQLLLECIDTLRSLPTRQVYTLPIYSNFRANRRIYLDTEKQARKINKLIKNLLITYRATRKQTYMRIFRITIPTNVYNTSIANRRTQKYRYSNTHYNSGVNTALAQGMHISGDVVLYTPEEISSVFRGEIIENLMQQLLYFAWITKCILRKYVRRSLTSKFINLYWIFAQLLSTLDVLGVHNSEKQKILNSAFSKYDPFVKQDSFIKNLEGASPALKKFVNKISIPLDLDNTYDPVAEKQIAKRLRDLSKALSTKYGVNYVPSAGDVVVAAMRKTEDLDEIMLDISAALEDCFGFVNAAADPTQE